MTITTAQATDWITVLRGSHDRLSALVLGLDESALEGPSYDTDWSIAQVLSHLGSSAEIFGLSFVAGVEGTEAPGGDVNQPIWDAWNAKGPLECRDDFLTADAAFVARIAGLSPEAAAGFRLTLFGMDLDLAGFVRMRLAEHAVHAWDVEVALDPRATVAEDAVQLLVDGLGLVATWSGKPSQQPYAVHIQTLRPARSYVVSVSDGVSLDEATDEVAADGSVTLPAEAFLRLVYGRLDPDHTPPATEVGSRGLDDLRLAFPGV